VKNFPEKQTSELKVFTAVRKLLAYIVQATEKSAFVTASNFWDSEVF